MNLQIYRFPSVRDQALTMLDAKYAKLLAEHRPALESIHTALSAQVYGSFCAKQSLWQSVMGYLLVHVAYPALDAVREAMCGSNAPPVEHADFAGLRADAQEELQRLGHAVLVIEKLGVLA